jgi:hypothetical protein
LGAGILTFTGFPTTAKSMAGRHVYPLAAMLPPKKFCLNPYQVTTELPLSAQNYAN